MDLKDKTEETKDNLKDHAVDKASELKDKIVEKTEEIEETLENTPGRAPASGLPTGKRKHKPFVIIKEIDKA